MPFRWDVADDEYVIVVSPEQRQRRQEMAQANDDLLAKLRARFADEESDKEEVEEVAEAVVEKIDPPALEPPALEPSSPDTIPVNKSGQRKGGHGRPPGFKLSPETREKIAQARKGRPRQDLTGEGNPKAKLQAEQVLEIRRLYSLGGTSYRKLADQFEVSMPLVRFIVKGKVWKHLLPATDLVPASRPVAA